MQLVIDADGLIKLNRAGVLRWVIEAFDCIIPSAVYSEVVTQGRARRYEDAEAIEAALTDKVQILSIEANPEPQLGLGIGEKGILNLLPRFPGSIVVSDDRRFLTVLSAEGIPFLTPADLLVVLTRREVLTGAQAREALENLRPAIRTKAYWDARTDLGRQLEGKS